MELTELRTTQRAGVGFACRLADHGTRPALITDASTHTYADLDALVAEARRRLGTTPRLVVLVARPDVDTIAAYLGALSGGHPVIVCGTEPAGHAHRLIAEYDPDVVIGEESPASWCERRVGTRHTLHPDLTLLLSTSGSTGEPKLVRLSRRGVESNAEAIATYLGLTSDDRAVTTLPLHYCYGLSVLHSHLARGASIVLTDASVVDPCFREALRRHGVTGIAGVPFTFELLERVDLLGHDLPRLRYLTQAGGRMCADRVRRVAASCEADGRRLFVMYGQTEATARMAYLPPDRVLAHPDCIGVPIPGGRFELAPIEGHEVDEGHAGEVGELTYHGDNVMLGYAHGPADLAVGATVTALHTGDLACRTPEGMYRIVGRVGRFIKPLGLRVDLDRVERLLAEQGVDAIATGDDEHLVVTVPPELTAARVTDLVAAAVAIPRGAISVLRLAEPPRLPSGKPDHRALTALAATAAPPAPTPAQTPDGASAGSPVRAAFEQVLHRRDVGPDATFVGLGGDSLSYVELSVRLEEHLGHLPDGWHLLPVARLERLEPRRRLRRLHRMDTTVVLRAVSIVLVAGSHLGAFFVLGGAHVMLAVAGFNFARFGLLGEEPPGARRRIGAAAARLAVPSLIWLTGLAALSRQYDWRSLTLVHHGLGPDHWVPAWNYWYIETLLALLGIAAAAFSLPAVLRLERRLPFALPVGLVVAALALRFRLVAWEPDTLRSLRPAMVVWIFLLGWAVRRATDLRRRVLATALLLVALPGFFDTEYLRTAVVGVGVLLLIWCDHIPVPAGLHRLVGTLASASLFIYLTHFVVYPPLGELGVPPWGALVACLVVGVAVDRSTGPLAALVHRQWRITRLRVDLHRGRRTDRFSRSPRGAVAPASR